MLQHAKYSSRPLCTRATVDRKPPESCTQVTDLLLSDARSCSCDREDFAAARQRSRATMSIRKPLNAIRLGSDLHGRRAQLSSTGDRVTRHRNCPERLPCRHLDRGCRRRCIEACHSCRMLPPLSISPLDAPRIHRGWAALSPRRLAERCVRSGPAAPQTLSPKHPSRARAASRRRVCAPPGTRGRRSR